MASLEDMTRLQRLVEDNNRKAAQAAGAAAEVMKAVQREHKVGTLAEAEKLLPQYQQQEQQAKSKFDNAYDAFMKEFGHLLED